MLRKIGPCSGELLTFVKRPRSEAYAIRVDDLTTSDPRQRYLKSKIREPFICFTMEMQAEADLFAHGFHRRTLWSDMAGDAT